MDNAPSLYAFCPRFHSAVELIGSRWTGAIVRAMLSGATRFTELKSGIPGLSDRMLSERLKELELAGAIRRDVIPTTPVRVEYLLTDKGLALASVVDAISVWATEWIEAPSTAEPQPAR